MVPTIIQHDEMDCGAACLRMIAQWIGRTISQTRSRELCQTNKGGSSLYFLAQGFEIVGFRSIGVRICMDELATSATYPYILHWSGTVSARPTTPL